MAIHYSPFVRQGGGTSAADGASCRPARRVGRNAAASPPTAPRASPLFTATPSPVVTDIDSGPNQREASPGLGNVIRRHRGNSQSGVGETPPGLVLRHGQEGLMITAKAERRPV